MGECELVPKHTQKEKKSGKWRGVGVGGARNTAKPLGENTVPTSENTYSCRSVALARYTGSVERRGLNSTANSMLDDIRRRMEASED